MLPHYFAIAVKVLLRRRFFTCISLVGISLTLLVLMVATAVLDHMFGPAAPETHQDRTLGVYRTTLSVRGGMMRSGAGFALVDRHARGLPGVERLSIFSAPVRTVSSYVTGRTIRSSLKYTDGEFWNILAFSFIEGAPYSARDVDEARFVAVINERTRRRFFGDRAAVGNTLEADGQRFRVVGVVEDVSSLREVPFADIWVPHTTSKSDAYLTELRGNFNAIVLAADRSMFPEIRAEFRSRLARIEFADPRYLGLTASLETHVDAVARRWAFTDSTNPGSPGRRLALTLGALAALFIFLPTVNLVNINVSRIMERRSEIGVRKAFGASSRTLVGQFVLENLLLTAVGGLLGFGLSVLVLRAVTESGIVPYARFVPNPRVFVYGLLLTLGFGVVSGVYPAWRMSRLHPAEALRGGDRR